MFVVVVTTSHSLTPQGDVRRLTLHAGRHPGHAVYESGGQSQSVHILAPWTQHPGVDVTGQNGEAPHATQVHLR